MRTDFIARGQKLQHLNGPLLPGPLLSFRGITKRKLLAALDKPRSLSMLLSMAGSRGVNAIQALLMQMRDEGLVKFDIKKGLWSRV